MEYSVVDVDRLVQFLKKRARIDPISAQRGKNTYFYFDPNRGLWNLLAWDMELTFETGRLEGGRLSGGRIKPMLDTAL